MTGEEYKDYIKNERKSFFESPYELAYQNFIKLGYDKKEPRFVFSNASNMVETLRKECWDSFVPIEKTFTSKMLQKLIDRNKMAGMDPCDAITSFLEEYPDQIYELSLSNTQSRRSRAGKEFEAIIELIMMAAGIPFDSQGNIGKTIFTDKGIGKMVDVVSPGAIEYSSNKHNTILISAKTTLRERWQEVPEEVSRTGASAMLLATLDDSITSEVFNTLYEANIIVTTTQNIKKTYYPNNNRILAFENMLQRCQEKANLWSKESFSKTELGQKLASLEKQKANHQNHPFVLNYYENRIQELS